MVGSWCCKQILEGDPKGSRSLSPDSAIRVPRVQEGNRNELNGQSVRRSEAGGQQVKHKNVRRFCRSGRTWDGGCVAGWVVGSCVERVEGGVCG